MTSGRPEDEPPWDPEFDDGPPPHHAAFPWRGTANPNTADGELQNIAAFSAGFARLSGPRRRAAQVVVWLILLGFAVVVVYGVVGIFRIW